MRNLIYPIAIATSIAISLTACGNGAGGGEPPPYIPPTNTTPSPATMSKVGRTTVDHAIGNPSTVTAITAGVETVTPTLTATSLSAFTVNNNVGGSLYMQTSGISTAGIATLGAGGNVMKVGGTQWAYSRFGTYLQLQPNSNGADSQYIERNAPFSMAVVSMPPNAISATYANSGKAVGTFAISDVAKAEVVCDVSVVLTVVGSTKRAEITFSNCVSNSVSFPVTGTAKIEQTPGVISYQLNPTFTLTHVNSATGINTTLSVNSLSWGYYLLGGPNAEELVGTLTLEGVALSGGVNKTGVFNVAFGVKK